MVLSDVKGPHREAAFQLPPCSHPAPLSCQASASCMVEGLGTQKRPAEEGDRSLQGHTSLVAIPGLVAALPFARAMGTVKPPGWKDLATLSIPPLATGLTL
ncbi:UNVERIFIED_CONTAM: hypothetical protein K2H54_022889 [Gekko kuhli]